MVAHTCNSRTRNTDAGRLWVRGWPRLCNEFQVSLEYLEIPCLKKPETERQRQREEREKPEQCSIIKVKWKWSLSIYLFVPRYFSVMVWNDTMPMWWDEWGDVVTKHETTKHFDTVAVDLTTKMAKWLSTDTLDKGMIHILEGMLLRMAHNLKHINYFWKFSLNIFGLWLIMDNRNQSVRLWIWKDSSIKLFMKCILIPTIKSCALWPRFK
jgi:hypothetical protein